MLPYFFTLYLEIDIFKEYIETYPTSIIEIKIAKYIRDGLSSKFSEKVYFVNRIIWAYFEQQFH